MADMAVVNQIEQLIIQFHFISSLAEIDFDVKTTTGAAAARRGSTAKR